VIEEMRLPLTKHSILDETLLVAELQHPQLRDRICSTLDHACLPPTPAFVGDALLLKHASQLSAGVVGKLSKQ
jgi:hypothetical protein